MVSGQYNPYASLIHKRDKKCHINVEYKTSASVNGHIKDVKEKRQEEINPIVKGKRRKTKMKITTEKLDEMMQDYLEIWSQQYIIITNARTRISFRTV